MTRSTCRTDPRPPQDGPRAELRRVWTKALPVVQSPPAKLALTLTGLGIAAWLIRMELQTVTFRQIGAAIRATPLLAILAAILFTAISYTSLGVVEWCAVRFIGRRVPKWRAGLIGMASAALSFAMGFGLASGAAVRLRLYSFAKMSAAEIAGLNVVLSAATFLSGMATGALAAALAPAPIARALGWPTLLVIPAVLVFVSPAALWFTMKPHGTNHPEAKPPGPAIRGTALAAGFGDWIFSGSALYVLSAHDPSGLPLFLAIFCLGSLLGSIVGTPGGLGVLDATVLGLHGHGELHQTAAALILYRAIYFLGPLILAAGGTTLGYAAKWARTHRLR